MARELKLWNGRGYGLLPTQQCARRHLCIAAYGVRDARELCLEIFGSAPSKHEIKTYWSPVWGNVMDAVKAERGVWIADDVTRRVVRVRAKR